MAEENNENQDLPTGLHCKVCGHDWFPRMGKLPKICPKCGSRYWRKGRQRASRAEQLAKAAAKREQQLAELLSFGAPEITDEMRQKAFERMGGFFKPTGQSYSVGITNAGPWRDITDQEPEHVTDFDLLGWRDGDSLWRVNTLEEDGQCLTGDDIFPGDILHFRPGIDPRNNDIVLAIGHDVSGNFFSTAKHFYKNGFRWDGKPAIELRPSNSKCKTITVFPNHLEIHGVLINILRLGVRKITRGRKL